MRRLFWLGVGAAAGAGGTLWSQRKLREQIEALGPQPVVTAAGRGAKAVGRTVTAAVGEGRAAAAAKEAELRERLQGGAAVELHDRLHGEPAVKPRDRRRGTPALRTRAGTSTRHR